MPSPKNKEPPISPAKRIHRFLLPAEDRRARMVKAKMPPSPRLSARMSTMTYLIVTMMVRAQTISESTPNTRGVVTAAASWKHRVERRGADVAVDNAERRDCQV